MSGFGRFVGLVWWNKLFLNWLVVISSNSTLSSKLMSRMEFFRSEITSNPFELSINPELVLCSFLWTTFGFVLANNLLFSIFGLKRALEMGSVSFLTTTELEPSFDQSFRRICSNTLFSTFVPQISDLVRILESASFNPYRDTISGAFLEFGVSSPSEFLILGDRTLYCSTSTLFRVDIEHGDCTATLPTLAVTSPSFFLARPSLIKQANFPISKFFEQFLAPSTVTGPVDF